MVKDHEEAKDSSVVFNRTLTPIGRLGNDLTESEKGDGSADDFEEEPPAVIVKNQKHFSKNDRLHSAQGLEASARRSLRLTPERKTTDMGKVKGASKARVEKEGVLTTSTPRSSCKDTAPLFQGKIPQKTTQKLVESDVTSTKVKTAKDATKKATSTVHPPPEKTVRTDKEKSDVKKKGDKTIAKPMSAAERKAAAIVIPVEKPVTKEKDNVKRKATPLSAADRKKAVVTPSTADDSKIYDVSLDKPWFEKQGPGYRKYQEAEKKKKPDPLFAFLEKKAEQMEKVTSGLNKILSEPAGPSGQASGSISAEQLWADSLVPQLMRMEQDTRDEFMGHVITLAFKAVRNKWP